MITSGYPRSSATRKTEIVDVTNGLTCSNLNDFPEKIYGTVGANLGGTPVVCGGVGFSGYSNWCHRYNIYKWEKFATMKERRQYATGVMHNDKLHVFGGRSSSNSKSQTTETINVDGDVSYGPDLPTAIRYHAMTKINNTVSLISGGQTSTTSNSAQTWYYHHETEAFTSGPDLLEGRQGHGSATNVDKVTKAEIVVITEGDSTELLINGQWQSGTI